MFIGNVKHKVRHLSTVTIKPSYICFILNAFVYNVNVICMKNLSRNKDVLYKRKLISQTNYNDAIK